MNIKNKHTIYIYSIYIYIYIRWLFQTIASEGCLYYWPSGHASSNVRQASGLQIFGVLDTASLTRSRKETSGITSFSCLRNLTGHLHFNLAHHHWNLIGTNHGAQIWWASREKGTSPLRGVRQSSELGSRNMIPKPCLVNNLAHGSHTDGLLASNAWKRPGGFWKASGKLPGNHSQN